jgi:hypothetical protein
MKWEKIINNLVAYISITVYFMSVQIYGEGFEANKFVLSVLLTFLR